MKKTVTTKLGLNGEEASWLSRLLVATYIKGEPDEEETRRRKIYKLCDYTSPTSTHILVLDEKEVDWLKALVQNPRCHPDNEGARDKEFRHKFWTTLSDDIVRAAHAATPEDDDIPF